MIRPSAIVFAVLFTAACECQKKSSAPRKFTFTQIGENTPDGNPHFFPVTELNYAQIDKSVVTDPKPYTGTLTFEKDKVSFEMIPIPGGEFLMGSPETEPGRKPDEGPQRKVSVDPFWMAKTETTWNLYHRYMEKPSNRNRDGTLNGDNDLLTFEDPLSQTTALIDAIAQPSPPNDYPQMRVGDNYTFRSEYPAVRMTQHAASKFCEWLTAKTGHYYRLPTEAEWEFACRAGTTTAYSFGDDLADIDDYAWYSENSDFQYHKVGLKRPNPFGLHDMHGNVAEWTLDAHLGSYENHPNGVTNPLALSEKRYPRVVRGGSWVSGSEELRSTARLPSSAEWQLSDPMSPKSIWHHTEEYNVGFRIVRPVKVPSLEEVHLLWNTGPGRPPGQ